jgi:hypothetical protein
MINHRLSFSLSALVVAAAVAVSAAPAAPRGTADIGAVHLTFGHTELSGPGLKNFQFTNGVTARSNEYSFSADTLTGVRWSGKPAGGNFIDHAVATGDLRKHTQVRVETQSVNQGYKNIIWADNVTYLSDPTFATDGTMTFTGHVKMETHDPLALAEPGITTYGKLVVTFGKGEDYPKIEGDDGDATFVPNQGSK